MITHSQFRSLLRAFVLPSLLLSLASGISQAAPEKLRVVASILPMYAHAKSVAGNLAGVEMLLDKNTGPHDFSPKPDDIKKLAQADLLVINGMGIEEWLTDLTTKAGNKNLTLVDCSQGVAALAGPEELEMGEEKHQGHDSHGHEGHGHAHGGANPHIWLDPVIAQQQAATITAALSKADPANAAGYQKNAGVYLSKLQALDREFRGTLDQLPNKNLVTFHDAFPYLAKRYGLNYVGFIEEFPEKDPKPGELAALVKAIRSRNVKVLFAESGYSPKLLEAIAQQTGAGVAELNTLETGEATADAYLDGMRKNLAALQKAWKD